MPFDVSIEETARLKEALRAIPVSEHPIDAPPAEAIEAFFDHIAQTEVVALEYAEPAPAAPDAPALDLSSLDIPPATEGELAAAEAAHADAAPAEPLGLFAAEQPEEFEEVLETVVTRRKKVR